MLTWLYKLPRLVLLSMLLKDIDWLVDLSNLQGLPKPPDLEKEPEVITPNAPIRIRMLKSLGLNYYDNYVTHVTHSLTPSLYSTIKDPIKIPRTNGKLKAWLIAMRSAYSMVFPEIFKCLVQPDPVNNTNTQSHFQYLADNTSITDAAKYLDRKVTMYNYSCSVVAEVIKQVLVGENDIYMDTVNHLKHCPSLQTDGTCLFYLLKQSLALRSKTNVQSLLNKLHECTMHTQNKFPAWQSWIENVNEIREELEGYNYALSDTLLLTKFQDHYYRIMDAQHGYNANAIWISCLHRCSLPTIVIYLLGRNF
jgi:hypothetical protein